MRFGCATIHLQELTQQNGTRHRGLRAIVQKQRQFVRAPQGQISVEQIGSADDGAHVGVKMGEVNSGGFSFVDLGACFGFHIADFCVTRDVLGGQRQVAVGVEQARVFGLGGDRSPAQRGPLGIQREVDAEVGVRMCLCPVRDFRKPRARDQDARRGDPMLLERFDDGAVNGMRHTEVIGVNHQ